MRNKKAAVSSSGGAQTITAAKLLSASEYTTPRPNMQSVRYLSAMLDQALYLAEYHTDRADFHRCQALKHRKVLSSLQGLIPRRQLNSEGDSVNG